MTLLTRRRLGALALLSGLIPISATAAEVKELRISQQFGIGYLPLQVARHQGLFDKQARAHGLDGLKVAFVTLGGGTSANDALLSNSVDIACGGVGPFLTVWDKTRGAYDVKGVAAVSAMPIALVTTNPAVRTLADFTDRDRIGLPAVKSSIQAVTLQIAAEKVFGPGQHEKLDAITVSMKHPDAYAALASGKSEITAHFGGPPFQQQELALPNARRITDSYEALGGPVSFNIAWAKKSFHDANPRVIASFIAALDEADALIAADPAAAAKIHLAEESSSADEALVRAIIADPASKFTTAPLNITRYADFLARTGQIRSRPQSWKNLFFAEIHALPGS